MKPIFLFGILLLAQTVLAQEKTWTMEDCIRYAVEHNPQRTQQEAQNTIYKIDQQEAIAGFLPSLTAESGISTNFGRGVDPETNTYISTNTFGNSYDIYSSMTLFDGLSQIYRAKLAKINHLMGNQQLQDVKDRIALETMEIFFNVRYYKGTVNMADQQWQESTSSLKRIQRMEELGMKAAPDVAEIRAKEAEDRFLLTQQKNLLRIETIKLKEKMNFPAEEELLVADAGTPELIPVSDENAVTVYEQALQTLPKILSAKESLKATEAAYKIARGRIFPTLSLGAQFSTGFSRLMDGSSYMSFSEQLKNREGTSVALTLSIPVFDRLSRPSEARRAKQRLVIARSEHEATLRQIYSEIEQAVADVRGLQDESRSAHEKTEAMREAHKVNARKYDEGLINAIELATSANRLLNARVEELHTHLKYQLKGKLLQYYKGEFNP
ncbi:transporter [Bacteroidia bacterium]|nr:transporter [Bacteroidia bacterium]